MTETEFTRRRALEWSVSGILVTSTAGCLGSGSPGRTTITMTEDLQFDPETVRVAADETVVWENPTSIDHTVTALEATLPESARYFASGGFDSESEARENPNAGLIEPEETYEHTFRQPGTVEYVCLPHAQAGMRGTVIVTTEDGEG